MKVSNDIYILVQFYSKVALKIKQSKMGYITLSEAESITNKHAEIVFSWLQWSDAKNWFISGTCIDGICYHLRREYAHMLITEIWADIRQYYKL